MVDLKVVLRIWSELHSHIRIHSVEDDLSLSDIVNGCNQLHGWKGFERRSNVTLLYTQTELTRELLCYCESKVDKRAFTRF